MPNNCGRLRYLASLAKHYCGINGHSVEAMDGNSTTRKDFHVKELRFPGGLKGLESTRFYLHMRENFLVNSVG